MPLGTVALHALTYVLVTNGYLFLVMIATSPRIWGYHDYPATVRAKVPPQTKKERAIGALLALPWMAFVLGFPVVSTYVLKSSLGGEIPFLVAFLNPLVLLQLANVAEVLILDWLIVSKMTPPFVILPGSTAEDYKDMTHHFKGHLRAGAVMVVISLVIGLVVYLT
ncbi:MAG: hypothetical protein AMS21_13375 [Gemmatimonas sp. SG8_38_2]|nr:MAG: hypothetical protein AMS21_13375 [Gemmatimonas sp. SG8_38_2]